MKDLKSQVQFLEELVKIPSGPDSPEGVLKIFKKLELIFTQNNFQIRYFENPDHKFKTPPLFIAEKRGSNPNPKNWITLISHADTVFTKKDQFQGFQISADGQSAIGSGVIDNKGGVVIALSALINFCQRNKVHKQSFRFICTPNEEQGTQGFHFLLKKLGEESKFLLGFEPALPDGSFIKSRRANRWYEISVHGRAAHSGRNFHYGVNAAFEMARKINLINELNNHNEHVNLSIGSIRSTQDRFNVICEEIKAKLDLRYTLPLEGELFHEKILEIINDHQEKSKVDGLTCSSRYSIEDDCPPLVEHPELGSYCQILSEIIYDIENIKVQAKHAHAASDCNYMSHQKLFAIDGLGACGTGMHEKIESILLSSLHTRSQAMEKFLQHLNTHLD